MDYNINLPDETDESMDYNINLPDETDEARADLIATLMQDYLNDLEPLSNAELRQHIRATQQMQRQIEELNA